MKANMGSADRVIRLILAIVMATLFFTGTIGGNLGLALLVLAVVFLATSMISFCPLYAPFRFSTRKP
jgi:hypothetical protein